VIQMVLPSNLPMICLLPFGSDTLSGDDRQAKPAAKIAVHTC